MIPCPSEAAYYRHRYNGEEPCAEDRTAVNEASRQRRRARGVRPQKPARHGTHSKYTAGCRCPGCLAGHAEYMRDLRAGWGRKRQKERAWKLRDAVLDWLTLDGGWLTAEGLAVDLGRNHEAVGRILRGLRGDGVVVSRDVMLGSTERRTEWRMAS